MNLKRRNLFKRRLKNIDMFQSIPKKTTGFPKHHLKVIEKSENICQSDTHSS